MERVLARKLRNRWETLIGGMSLCLVTAYLHVDICLSEDPLIAAETARYIISSVFTLWADVFGVGNRPLSRTHGETLQAAVLRSYPAPAA